MINKNIKKIDKKVNIAGIILTLLSLFIITVAQSFPKGSDGLPGSGLFPNILAGFLLILSGLMIYYNINNNEEIKEKIIEEKAVITMGISFVYVVLLNTLGFLILTIPFLLILMGLFDKRDLKRTIPISVITVLVIYYVFGSLLNVPLPEQSIFM